MAIHIGRREFIATLGGAATCPLVARAQQPVMALVGLLSSVSPPSRLHPRPPYRA
jgi:hypothetical protein